MVVRHAILVGIVARCWLSGKEWVMSDAPRPPLRLRRPTRDQVTPVPAHLDALLPDDHLAITILVGAGDERQFEIAARGPGSAAQLVRLKEIV